MTPKQQAFVEHYAACGNATEAARRAGYKQPHVLGTKTLENIKVQAALAELTEKVSSARIADAKERQEFWTSVMRSRDEGFEGLEMKDRLKASELLGRANLDFVEKVEVTHNNPPNVRLVVVHVQP